MGLPHAAFLFVVPFKCRECCADWSAASRLCCQAVASMLAGAGDHIRVILVCHQVPGGLPRDDRLLIHQVLTPVPSTPQERMEDKYFKIKTGLVAARPFAPCWLMRADADDLISNRLVPFVTAQKPGEAWFVENGWIRADGSSWIRKLGGFHKVCGTSCITYVTADDLPADMSADRENFYLLTQGHNIVVDHLRQKGVPTHPLPFRAVMYVSDSGENWSGRWLTKPSPSRRWMLWRWTSVRPLSRTIRREFHLPASTGS